MGGGSITPVHSDARDGSCISSIDVFSDGDTQAIETVSDHYPVLRWASGARLWRETTHSAASTLPVLEGCWFFPSSHNYNLTSRPDHIRAVFDRRVKLFVLWHTRILKTPTWLSRGFIRTGAVIPIKWRHPAWLNLAMALAGKKREMHTSGLRVWAAKAWLPAGQTVCLGGTEGSTFVDNNYILAWLPDTEAEAGASSIKMVGMHYMTSMPGSQSETRALMQQRLLEAVAHDDLPSLRSLIRESGLDVIDIFRQKDFTSGVTDTCHPILSAAYADPAKAPVLFTCHAASCHSLACLCFLITKGAQMDYSTLMYLIRQDPMLDQVHWKDSQPHDSNTVISIKPDISTDGTARSPVMLDDSMTMSKAHADDTAGDNGNDWNVKAANDSNVDVDGEDMDMEQDVATDLADGEGEGEGDDLAFLTKTKKAHTLEVLLSSYVSQSRQPLAAAACISEALLLASQETKSGRGPRLAALHRRFHALATELATRLDRALSKKQRNASSFVRKTKGEGLESVLDSEIQDVTPVPPGMHQPDKSASRLPASTDTVTLQDAINPVTQRVTIDDCSPLEIAFAMNDLDFVSIPTVQHYVEQFWMGEDYLALTHDERGDSGVNYYNNDMAAKMMQTGGFVGASLLPFARLFSQLAHVVVLTPRQFFDSPRGRWCFKLMTEVLLLVAYHSALLSDAYSPVGWAHYVLAAFVVGNLLQAAEDIFIEELNIGRYMLGWEGLDVLTSVMLLIVGIIRLSAGSPMDSTIPFLLSQQQQQSQPQDVLPDSEGALVAAEGMYTWLSGSTIQAQRMLFWAAALPLWARMLMFLAPIHPEFGPLINIVLQMVVECVIFCVPFTVILLGAACALYGALNGDPQAAEDMEGITFPEVMLQLMQALVGVYDWTTLNQISDRGTFLFAKSIMVVYTMFATVVLSNLLIAVVTYKYKPDEMQALSRFQMAQTVVKYQRAAARHALPVPFNIVRLALSWLPAGHRPKANSKFWGMKFGQAPFDGLPLPRDQSRTFPTGRDELAYLVFLVTLYPVLMIIMWLSSLLLTPFMAFHFAAFGATSLITDMLERSDSMRISRPLRVALMPVFAVAAMVGLVFIWLLLLLFQCCIWSYLGKLVFHGWWFIYGAVLPKSAQGVLLKGRGRAFVSSVSASQPDSLRPDIRGVFRPGEVESCIGSVGLSVKAKD